MSPETTTARILQYDLRIDVAAPRDSVWRALTEETNHWWLPDFHMVGEGSVVTFDARAGGQLLETREDGGSLLWYTVHMCVPGRSLHMVGHIAPEWGGPLTTMLHLSLEEEGDGTVLHVHDAQFGHVTEEGAGSLREGWRQLFTDGLKRHAEAR